MENATKALIIAASVLIAIVLIAVGIKILGATKGTTDQVQTVSTTMEVAMFNAQFEKYEGKQRGSTIKALFRTVRQNNVTNPDKFISIECSERLMGGTYDSNEDEQAWDGMMNNISVNETYKVTTQLDEKGYIKTIRIY